MATDKSFYDYVMHEVIGGIPGISSKPMFGGFGLYKDGLIFGIIAGNTLYFKTSDPNRSDFERLGSQPFTYAGKNKKMTTLSYWELPAEIMEDKDKIRSWIEKSAAVSLETRRKK